jgi:hypothetical protein
VAVVCDNGSMAFSEIILYEPLLGVIPEIFTDDLPFFCAGDAITLASSSATNNLWGTGEETAHIDVQESGTYTVSVTGPCETQTSAPLEITMLDPGAPPVMLPVVYLSETGTALLSTEGDHVWWYDVPVNGTPVGAGNGWETPVLEGPTTFWGSNVVLSDPTPPAFGGPSDRTSNGQYHNNGNFHLRFTANSEFVIHSVKVFANGAGNRPIGLVNAAGNPVQQGSFLIPDGESRVQLGFVVPGPGQYSLRIMGGNPQLWRDGLGSNLNYPYALGPYGTITGSSATTGATSYYYFFYDWEVGPRSVACESDRTAVMVDPSVGIMELQGIADLSFHPNPADDLLFVEIPDAAGGQVLQIMDMMGREVAMERVAGGRNAVFIGHLSQGVYQLRLIQGGIITAQGRAVIAR